MVSPRLHNPDSVGELSMDAAIANIEEILPSVDALPLTSEMDSFIQSLQPFIEFFETQRDDVGRGDESHDVLQSCAAQLKKIRFGVEGLENVDFDLAIKTLHAYLGKLKQLKRQSA